MLCACKSVCVCVCACKRVYVLICLSVNVQLHVVRLHTITATPELASRQHVLHILANNWSCSLTEHIPERERDRQTDRQTDKETDSDRDTEDRDRRTESERRRVVEKEKKKPSLTKTRPQSQKENRSPVQQPVSWHKLPRRNTSSRSTVRGHQALMVDRSRMIIKPSHLSQWLKKAHQQDIKL